MSKEAKKKTVIVSSIFAVLLLVLTIVLCLAFIHKDTNSNQSLEIENDVNGDSNTTYTYTDSSGTWTWYINDGTTTATIRKYNGSTSSVTIPGTIEKDGVTYTITALYDSSIANSSVFYGKTTLGSVTIPDSIINMGMGTFSGCSNLRSVIIGNGVTSIKTWTFYKCTSLSSVIIGSSVSSIGTSSFSESGLTSITIPDNVTDIGNSAFKKCTSLKTVNTGNGVTSIGDDAFYGCSAMTRITLGSSLQSVGDSFYSNGKLSAVYYQGTIEQWCRISFYKEPLSHPLCYAHKLYINNTLVTDLVIPSNVDSIGRNAFVCCTSITRVTFLHDYSNGVSNDSSSSNYIGQGAFASGNENVVYYFVNQASIDNVYTIGGSFTNTDFRIIPVFNVEINNSNWGIIEDYTVPNIGSSVTLIATPNIDCIFKYWLLNGGIYSDNNTITVTRTEDATYTAVFDILYTITTNVSNYEYGSVTNGGIYPNNTEVILIATPNEGCIFIKWLKNGEELESKNESLTVVVNENATYTAVFAEGYTIIVINLAYNEGSVSGGGDYLLNSQATLVATPNIGARFFYWLKNDQIFEHSLDQMFTIIVTENVTYTALFAPINYIPGMDSLNSIVLQYEYQGTETVNPEACGMLKFYCYGDFDNMTTVRVEAIPTSGYRFVGWKINGESTISSKYTTNQADILLTDIPNSKIVIAVFDKAT